MNTLSILTAWPDDERDRKRPVAPLRIAADAVLYDNSGSPSEEEDALILSYYIRHADEVLKNAPILRRKA